MNKHGINILWKYGKYALSPEEQQRISIEYGQYSAVEKADIIWSFLFQFKMVNLRFLQNDWGTITVMIFHQQYYKKNSERN